MSHAIRTHLESILPHAGQGYGDGEALIAPISQSTTFCRQDLSQPTEHGYSRQSNPTVTALEKTLGELEAAPPAVCYSTGLAAETALFLSFLSAGDHVLCSRSLYGGTTRLLEQIFPNFGVQTDFVDSTDSDEVSRGIRPNTKVVFIETPSNPTLEVSDITAIAKLAKSAGAITVVDNTFMTPLLQQPLALGADFSVYSTTKFIEGHSVALGGAIVGHDEEKLERLRFVRTSTGGIQTPFNAWLTLQGIKTLGIRLERQCATAAAIARWLDAHEAVKFVNYPGQGQVSNSSLCSKQHLGADGAVVSFQLFGGYEGATDFLSELKCCRLVEHVGGVETLLTHSASMTHGGVAKKDREGAGISEGLLRVSVGLEPLEVILEDFARALENTAVKKGEESCPQ